MPNRNNMDIADKVKEIRHEVNNNLMIIFGYTELLIKKGHDDDFAKVVDKNIDEAIENLRKIKDLSQKF